MKKLTKTPRPQRLIFSVGRAEAAGFETVFGLGAFVLVAGRRLEPRRWKARKITWNTRSSETPEWMCLESASVAWDSGKRNVGFTNGCLTRKTAGQVRGRLCRPATPQVGGARGPGDPQCSAPSLQPPSKWSARPQPLSRERLAAFPAPPAAASRLDGITGWRQIKCRSSWPAKPRSGGGG